MLGYDNIFSLDINQRMKHENTLCKSYLQKVIHIFLEDGAVEWRNIIKDLNIFFGQ